MNTVKKLEKTKMENTIPAKDRIIAWPRMGRIDIPLKALLVSLGAKVVIPPANSKETLEIGVRNSIEGICLPYKLNLANYIMALDKGANTLMMFQAPGSCRLGNYTKMAQKTLKSMGYKFDMVIFDMYKSKMKQTLHAFWHVTHCINPWRYYKGFSLGFNKFFAIDTAERLLFYTRPRELNKGDAEKCYEKWLKITDETNSVWEAKKLKKRIIEDFKKIPIDKNKKVPEIGYLFQKAFWHQGYAAETAVACKEYAFNVLNIDEVYSIIRDNNITSQNVAKKNGMTIKDEFVKHYYGMDMLHYVFSVKK